MPRRELLGRRELVLERSQVWNLASGTASWTYSFPASNFPADGTYTVEVRATDNALNVQSPVTTQAFTFDTTPPAVGPVGDRRDDGNEPGRVREAGRRLQRLRGRERRQCRQLRDRERLERHDRTDRGCTTGLCVELHRRRSHVRLQERAAHREHAARPGEQELHGERRRRRGQCQRACELQRAGGQHRPSR